jgi:hypothetical protein
VNFNRDAEVRNLKLEQYSCFALDRHFESRTCHATQNKDIHDFHLGQFFMEPSDYNDVPIDKALHFIRGVGLIKG